jgi:hypothetical protein
MFLAIAADSDPRLVSAWEVYGSAAAARRRAGTALQNALRNGSSQANLLELWQAWEAAGEAHAAARADYAIVYRATARTHMSTLAAVAVVAAAAAVWATRKRA